MYVLIHISYVRPDTLFISGLNHSVLLDNLLSGPNLRSYIGSNHSPYKTDYFEVLHVT